MPAPNPHISAHAAYSGNDRCSHEKIVFAITSAEGRPVGALTLAVSVADQRLEHVLAIDSDRHQCWTGIHRHLLAPGRHTVRCEAGRGPDRFWSFEFDLDVPPLNALGRRVRDSLLKRGTPAIFTGPLDTSFYDYQDETLFPWFDRPEAQARLELRLTRGEIDTARFDLLNRFVGDGFAYCPGLIDDRLLARLRESMEWAVSTGYSGYCWGSGQRLEHLHNHSPAMRELWTYPPILRTLRLIFEADPCPCQTLSFVFGSEQAAHQDTLHLTAFPAGYMMGVWVALEDIRPGSGELFYLKGSHRSPRLYAHHGGWPGLFGPDKGAPGSEGFSRLTRQAHAAIDQIAPAYERVDYLPKAGDVLFWHENLIHGGSPRVDRSLTRRSVAMHYFARGSIGFYDSWGDPAFMASAGEEG